MNKRHIPGFFDALARTPSFAFLCTMLMCGAAAGAAEAEAAHRKNPAISKETMVLQLIAFSSF